MMFSALSVLALCGLSFAAPSKRDATTKTAILATGTDLDPSYVFYANGLAYVGNSAPDWVENAVNITFSTSTSTDVPWTISANTTNSTQLEGSVFYILPDELSAVGFADNSDSAPTGAATTGFFWYGGAVSFLTESNVLQNFWALPTNTTGIYSLLWNPDATLDGEAIPVSLLGESLDN